MRFLSNATQQQQNMNNNDNLTVIPFCYCITYRIYLRCYGSESMHVVFMFFILFLSIAKAPQRATELSFGRHFHGAFDELACGFTDFSPHFLLLCFWIPLRF